MVSRELQRWEMWTTGGSLYSRSITRILGEPAHPQEEGRHPQIEESYPKLSTVSCEVWKTSLAGALFDARGELGDLVIN